MNDNVQLLLDALRSGDYEQGQGVLHSRDDKFCCLGVACEVFIQAEGNLTSTLDGERYVYGSDAGVLPSIVQGWLGFTTDIGSYGKDELYTSLVQNNDSNNMTLAEIADVIESAPTGLFEEESNE